MSRLSPVLSRFEIHTQILKVLLIPHGKNDTATTTWNIDQFQGFEPIQLSSQIASQN